MVCNACGDKPEGCAGEHFPKPVVEINNPEQIVLFRKVSIPASLGDETTVPPAIGKYHNVLLHYEATGANYIYSSDGIPTLLETEVPQEIYDQLADLRTDVDQEVIDRENADTALQGSITALDNSLATVAKSGDYNDLTNKPTIPTVNNATLTIQKNGTNVQTFTANSSTNKTANITVPTAVSELTNDSGYATTTQLNNGLATKQDTLTAGDNIQINGNTISATDTTYGPATDTEIGLVKPGDGLEVTSDGVLSVVGEASPTRLSIENMDTLMWQSSGESGAYRIPSSLSAAYSGTFISFDVRLTAKTFDAQFIDEDGNIITLQNLWERISNGEKFSINIPFNAISQEMGTYTGFEASTMSDATHDIDNSETRHYSDANQSETFFLSSALVKVKISRDETLYDAPFGVVKIEYEDSSPDDYAFVATVFAEGKLPNPV